MYIPRTGKFAAPVLAPGYRIRDNFSLIDVIQDGTEEFADCPKTLTASSQLIDTYPSDDKTFSEVRDDVYIAHLAEHAQYIGEKAIYAHEKARSPQSQPEFDVRAEPTFLALAIGSVLLEDQIGRIEEMEARYGQAGGKRPRLHAITKAVHYKDGPLQRLVALKSPDTFLHAWDFVEDTNGTIMAAAHDSITAILGNATADHTPESVTKGVITSLVSGQVATERSVFNEAMKRFR